MKFCCNILASKTKAARWSVANASDGSGTISAAARGAIMVGCSVQAGLTALTMQPTPRLSCWLQLT